MLETLEPERSSAPLSAESIATAMDRLEGLLRKRLNDRRVREGEEGLRAQIAPLLASVARLRGMLIWPLAGSDPEVLDLAAVAEDGRCVVAAVRERMTLPALAEILDATLALRPALPALLAAAPAPVLVGTPRLLLAAREYDALVLRALQLGVSRPTAYDVRTARGGFELSLRDLLPAAPTRRALAREPFAERGAASPSPTGRPRAEAERSAREPMTERGGSRGRRAPRAMASASASRSPSEAPASRSAIARGPTRSRRSRALRRRRPAGGAVPGRGAGRCRGIGAALRGDLALRSGGRDEARERAKREAGDESASAAPAPARARRRRARQRRRPARGRGRRARGAALGAGVAARGRRRSRRGSPSDDRPRATGRRSPTRPSRRRAKPRMTSRWSSPTTSTIWAPVCIRLSEDVPELEEEPVPSYDDEEEFSGEPLSDEERERRERELRGARASRRRRPTWSRRPAPQLPRRRAAFVAHADRDSLAAAIVLARDLRLRRGLLGVPAGGPDDVLPERRDRSARRDPDLSWSASRRHRRATRSRRPRSIAGRIAWFDHHDWPPEDIESAARGDRQARTCHVQPGAGSSLPLVLDVRIAPQPLLGQARRADHRPLLPARSRALGPRLVAAPRRARVATGRQAGGRRAAARRPAERSRARSDPARRRRRSRRRSTTWPAATFGSSTSAATRSPSCPCRAISTCTSRLASHASASARSSRVAHRRGKRARRGDGRRGRGPAWTRPLAHGEPSRHGARMDRRALGRRPCLACARA